MGKSIASIRLAFLPVLLFALLIQAACDDTKPGSYKGRDTARVLPDTARPEIPMPGPDATIIDSLTHDFSGVWIGDSVRVPNAVSVDEGLISFCPDGKVRYQVFRNGPVLSFSAKQVWIDRRHVHIDMFLTDMQGINVEISEAAMPVQGKLFATADLVSNSRMSILWYPRDFIAAIREQGSTRSPEAFPAMFYYTTRTAPCQ